MFGLAIYDRELTAAEALLHYQSWKKHGHPDANEIALYLFDEKTGNEIHNHAAAGGELYIPGNYTVVDQVFLRPLWEEFDFTRSYWSGNLKNVVGFIPTGFCFYAYLLASWPAKRALLITVVLGFLVSLTIEVLQAYLPTRDSGTTDLITNTLGTYAGVLCYRLLPDLAKKHPSPIR
jgi:glycopeptide antibiotics resistance protein